MHPIHMFIIYIQDPSLGTRLAPPTASTTNRHDDPFDPQLHQDLLAQQPKQRHHHQDHPKWSVPLLPGKVLCKKVGTWIIRPSKN